MRRLVLLVVLGLALLLAAVAFDWQIDPSGLVWKPDAVAAARSTGCLVSEELIGSQYWAFKRDVFFHRPTRRFVVGSSRVLKMSAGDPAFSNLGYPGTSPETILQLLRSLPASPTQTVYVGVEAFWLNANYVVPATNPSDFAVLEYLAARSTFRQAWSLFRQKSWLLDKRWQRSSIGDACVLDRFYHAISWRMDGSRVWGWELDPKRFPRFHATPFDGDLATWRNGYFAGWSRLDPARVHALEQVLALARARSWNVVGFAPPEPPNMLHLLDTDPRLAPQWHAYLQLMPRLFSRYGFRWLATEDGAALGCRASDFPDAFHSDARCSGLLLRRVESVHLFG